jgi:hypothetical protein
VISQAQLRCLQTLSSQATFDGETESEKREARLTWAGELLGRTVTSFRELRDDEAAKLIAALKEALGQLNDPPRRRNRSRESSLAGRRGVVLAVEILASNADRAAVDDLRRRVGMSEEAFANWLGSSRSSPTRGRRELRTAADCNRARWALKSMLRRVG